MKETIRTARKQHRCGWCDGIIYPGNKYIEMKWRAPVGDELGQTGIEYVLHREHLNNSCKGRLQFISTEQYRNIITKCNKGNHDFKQDYEVDAYDCYPVGTSSCVNCGIKEE